MWRLFVVATACGRIGFDPHGTTAPDSPRSPPEDASSVTDATADGSTADATLDGAVAVAQDFTADAQVTQTGFVVNMTTGIWSATVMVMNTSATTIPSPVSVVFDNLSSNATAYQPTGYTALATPANSPYDDLSGAIPPGSTGSQIIQFTNPSSGFITYTARILAGSGAR